VVITAHGTLEPWALNRSRWKKRATGLLFQDRDLREADCIHVNSQQEIAGVRSYGLRNPIAVIPNGVDLAAFDDLPPRSAFDEVFPQLADKRLCLFLSRLHDKKGLGHLIAAWSRLGRKFDDWHLLIAGPDDGYERRLRDAVTELNLTSSVTIAGPLYGDEKRAALSAAELFVLPSFSEGFSMAVLEAMACGLPVLITSGCNFAEAGLAGAAIEAAATVEGTESGLRELLSRGAAELKAMGELGRALIELRYTWDAVAQRTLELYGWLARGGARPKFVVE
jgi:glycosyltransferase involved in cell wall biosynthesis